MFGGDFSMRFISYSTLCLLLIFSQIVYAESINNQIASKETILLEATISCGWGEIFYISKNMYSKSEEKRIKFLLNFRFSGRDIYPISFEQYGDQYIGTKKMTLLLNDRNFRQWVGRELLNKTLHLIAKRQELETSKDRLPKDPSGFFKHPSVKAYEQSAEEFMIELTRRFKITAKENGVNCD